MRKGFYIALLVLLVLTGCGSKEVPETVPPTTEAVTEVPTTEAPTTEAPTTEAPAAEIPEETAPAEEKPVLTFTTTDLAGETVTEAIFDGYDLVMINLWEPWCGPCVGEMPDLEKLYQAYSGRLLILGAFATEDGVKKVLEDTGVTYPIIHYTPVFYRFTTPYIPTTVLLDGQGNLLYGPVAGSRPYETWTELIDTLLP